MIQSKRFPLDNAGERKVNFEIGENEDKYALHISVEEDIIFDEKNVSGTVGWLETEDLRVMIDLIDRFLASRSESNLHHEFEAMYMENRSLRKSPNWIKKGNLKLGLGVRDDQHVLQFDMSPNSNDQGFNIAIKTDKENSVLDGLRQLLRDFTKTPINIDRPKDVPGNLSTAKSRLDIAIQKFYMEDYKGAIGEARECFHAIQNQQEWMKKHISERKMKDILGSRSKIVSNGLHCEQRDENLTPEDAELVLRDVSNFLNYVVNSLE